MSGRHSKRAQKRREDVHRGKDQTVARRVWQTFLAVYSPDPNRKPREWLLVHPDNVKSKDFDNTTEPNP